MKIKCYKYSLSDEPSMVFEAKTTDELIDRLAKEVSWRNNPNEIWVKIGCENSLLYEPMLDTFRDWDGYRFVQIDRNKLDYYFTR